ncbi:glycosyltransferase family 2 protein [Candidatus Woesearchaeota archaeon]|nr:glycosyltransferase family 2 protein [Candidatus Woesearchaeota archaeon]MCF8012928.1 glycosyltransferase family 2 protein [Candidatus Woesearchaeota archaeon]
MVKFSVVVPVYNEVWNLEKFHSELISVISKMGTYEVIYVNDGSNDDSLNILKKLKKAKVLDLQRNYGQSTALDCGFKESTGDFVISMDGDLQNDPHDIPRLYAKLIDKNLDVVAGWRVKRKDSFSVRTMTKIARFIRRLLVSDVVHDQGCTLRVYRSRAIKSLELWGEMHRYIISLLKWKGFKIGELKVKHRPRYKGTTKYTGIKLINGFTDLILIWFLQKYSRRPLHIFGGLAFLSFGAGVLLELIMIYLKLTSQIDLSDNALFTGGIFLIMMSVLFFVSGILVDMQMRIYYNTSRNDKRYIYQKIK